MGDSDREAMPTVEDYRRKAEECRRLSKHAADETEREGLLRMAEQWEPLSIYKAKRESPSSLG
jgi:hypothetical protein